MIPIVLSIDDDKTSQLLMAAYLKDVDFCQAIVSKADGQEALAYLEEVISTGNEAAIPNLIFLDIKMPVLDGWGFLEGYEKLAAQLELIPPVVMVSATNTDEDRIRAENNPFVSDLILKPISSNALLKFIKHPALKGFFSASNRELTE